MNGKNFRKEKQFPCSGGSFSTAHQVYSTSVIRFDHRASNISNFVTNAAETALTKKGVNWIRQPLSVPMLSSPSKHESPIKLEGQSRKRRKRSKPQSNTMLNYFPRSDANVENDSSRSPSSPISSSQDDFLTPTPNSPVNDDNSCSSVLSRVPSEASENSLMFSVREIDKPPSENSTIRNAVCNEIDKTAEALAGFAAEEWGSNSPFQEDCYGLLGLGGECRASTDEETDNGPSYFDLVPSVVLEEILCQLPLADLLLNFTRVCQAWNQVISARTFIPWKKKYHMLKSRVASVVAEIGNTATSAGMLDSLQVSLPKLVHYMNAFNLSPVQNSIQSLQKHYMYSSAELLIEEKLPECIKNSSVNLWAAVAALVVLSDSVWDVYEIMKCLVGGPCPVIDAIEALYCICTFLLYLKRHYRVGYGLHFRVYYALYYFENNWTAKLSDLNISQAAGQQSLLRYAKGDAKLRLTHEQMRIVNHALQPHHILKIVAFAGSGKTSTLVEYARMNPGLKFLAVMYNKAVADHAKKCFPPNVECRTSHSLAWATQGSKLKGKLTSKIRPHDIMEFLTSYVNEKGIGKQQHASCVIKTVESFMASPDEFITIAHVPTRISKAGYIYVLTDRERLLVTNDAESIWQKMINPRDYEVRAVHDCYLKLFQLSKIRLMGYNCILIDEAQDCNAATLHLLLSQNCAKIVVGDPNQQIYGFRGAVDALNNVESTHTFYLTQSFRFGPEIAYVASLALELFKQKDEKTLVGGAQRGSVMGSSGVRGQVGVLARSNVAIFNEVVRMLLNGPSRSYDPEYVLGAFAGGIRGYALDQLVDIYNLMQGDGEPVSDRFIRRFKSFASLYQYAKNVEDTELLGKIILVKQHAHHIPEYVRIIKSRCQNDPSMANVVFSTVHKAKGLEFDTVCILDDFTIGQFPYSQSPDPNFQEEYNVMYVALTRAKHCLLMPSTLYFLLLGAHEKFEYPVIYLEEDPACCDCKNILKPFGSFVMARSRLELVNCMPIAEGYICNDCMALSDFMPPITHPQGHHQQPLHDYHHEMFRWIVT